MKSGWSVAAPMMPWEGRRLACVLVSNEIMASIIRGEMDKCMSDAPDDLIVVGATTLDSHRIGIYIESEMFEPLDERGVVPVLIVTLSEGGGEAREG